MPNSISGDLNSIDPDGPNDSWVAVLAPTTTFRGYATFTIDATGHWTYTLDNSNPTINALNGLLTQKFLETRQETDPAITGLSDPTLHVTLEGNNRRETLLLGLPVAGAPATARSESEATPRSTLYYAKIEDKPAVFTTALPAKLLVNLQQAQEFLRDPRILEFDPHAVTAITLAAPGQPELNLQRLETTLGTESWQLINRSNGSQAPQTLSADTTIVADLLPQCCKFR